MILHSDWRDLPQRRADDALDDGYVPDASDFRPLPEVIRDPDTFAAEIEAAKEFARTHTVCGVPNCGFNRCSVCGDRICCTGPLPAVACGAHDDECIDCNAANPCRDCATARRSDPRAPSAYVWPDDRNSA